MCQLFMSVFVRIPHRTEVRRIHPHIETQRRHPQNPKTAASVAPQKGLMPPKFKKKIYTHEGR